MAKEIGNWLCLSIVITKHNIKQAGSGSSPRHFEAYLLENNHQDTLYVARESTHILPVVWTLILTRFSEG